jgi:hypothetical protein
MSEDMNDLMDGSGIGLVVAGGGRFVLLVLGIFALVKFLWGRQ